MVSILTELGSLLRTRGGGVCRMQKQVVVKVKGNTSLAGAFGKEVKKRTKKKELGVVNKKKVCNLASGLSIHVPGNQKGPAPWEVNRLGGVPRTGGKLKTGFWACTNHITKGVAKEKAKKERGKRS